MKSQAIVQAFGLDERTVAEWRDRAGQHCQDVHEAIVEQGKLDLVHVQADEIRVKGRKMIAWMGLAMMVSTRLWVAGTVSLSRDKGLADALLHQVRRAAQRLRPLRVLTDGWAAYPGSIRRAFREKVKVTPGPGRACLRVWPELQIGTVIKHTEKKRVVEITRQMAHGILERAEQLLQLSRGGDVREYRVYRTLEWHLSRTAGELDTQKSACGFTCARLAHGHVPDWLHLQFLCDPSGTLQRETLGKGMHSRDSERADRSCLEFR